MSDKKKIPNPPLKQPKPTPPKKPNPTPIKKNSHDKMAYNNRDIPTDTDGISPDRIRNKGK